MKFIFVLTSMISLAIVRCLRVADHGRQLLTVPLEVARAFASRIIMAPFRQALSEGARIVRIMRDRRVLSTSVKPEYRQSYDTHGLSLVT